MVLSVTCMSVIVNMTAHNLFLAKEFHLSYFQTKYDAIY